jgi:hypothetical protein
MLLLLSAATTAEPTGSERFLKGSRGLFKGLKYGD